MFERRNPMTESCKDIAVAFLEMVSSGEVQEAYSRFVGSGFKHHNPFYEGSATSLSAGMEENARQNPAMTLEVKRAIAEADFVVVHSHVCQTSLDSGAVVVHIFRFENERIVELWDVGQPIPDESANQYGMF
jgi:predicted SnoaL-like aldol condensation-catalyzing enzyme